MRTDPIRLPHRDPVSSALRRRRRGGSPCGLDAEFPKTVRIGEPLRVHRVADIFFSLYQMPRK
jgi:hypothetical protein